MMIRQLQLINIGANYKGPLPSQGHLFTIATCQRKIIIGLNQRPYHYLNSKGVKDFSIYNNVSAYEFLLETLCGLKSKMLAENEIVTQFKSAFEQYLKSSSRNTYIINLLEKAFKDAKKIRTAHLKKIGQLSYAGISRKLLMAHRPKKILIIGSGALAEDLIKLLDKSSNVTLSARNHKKVDLLSSTYKTQLLKWKQDDKMVQYSHIVNTVGADEILFNPEFFDQWSNIHADGKLFIDLGSPSVLKTDKTVHEGVVQLADILNFAEVWGIEKMNKVDNAKSAISTLALNRAQRDSFNIPYGWEELQFA